MRIILLPPHVVWFLVSGALEKHPRPGLERKEHVSVDDKC